ncbi:MAG TPA: hypothetical protein VF945_17755 [Polyangia bacterium]
MATQPTPVRLAVHVDTLDPDKVQQYEQARVRWVAALRGQHASDRRGLYLKIGSNTYYSVVSFGRWRELDEVGAQRRKTTARMGAAATEYDRLCDEALVFPHTSEVWSEEPGLSYLPTGRRLTDAVQLVIEEVKPTADYEAAWKPIAAALAQARHPVERRSYFSSWGSGRVLSFWLAPSTAVLQAAPTVAQALESVVGVERAAALLAAWRACVLSSQTLDVEPKPEMSSP